MHLLRPTVPPTIPATLDVYPDVSPLGGESGGGVWTPAALGAAQLAYYDAHDSSYSGGTLGNLGSLGSAADAVQGTAGKRATKAVGNAPSGRDTLSFDGSDDTCISALLSAVSQPYTVTVVCRSATTANSKFVCDGQNGSNRSSIAVSSATQYFGYAGGAAFPMTPSITVSNTWHVLLFEVNGASSLLYAGNVAGVAADPGANTWRGVSLGSSHDTAATYCQMHLAEYRMINRLLTPSERTSLYLYQRARWGV